MRVIAIALCVVASAATASAFVPMGPPPLQGARSSSMPAMHAEAGAKAWLESNQSPFWSPPDASYGVTSAGVVGSAAAAPTASAAVGGAWLAAGTPVLTLDAADEMSRVALQQAALHASAPVSVCVLDATGRTLVVKTMVDCATLAPDLALAKARTCVGFHMSSRTFKDSYVNGEGGGPKMPQALAMVTIGAAAGQAVASFPGGVLCRDGDMNVVGAIGVSGARSDEDEHCAILGAQAVGLVTEPAQSSL